VVEDQEPSQVPGAGCQVPGARCQAPALTGSVSGHECQGLRQGVLAAELSLPPSFFQLAKAGGKGQSYRP